LLSVTRFQNVAEVGETGRNWSAIKRRPAKRNDMRDSVYRERKHEELGRELEKKEMAVPDFEADAPTPERSLENYHLLPSARRSPRKAEPPRRSPRGVRARFLLVPKDIVHILCRSSVAGESGEPLHLMPGPLGNRQWHSIHREWPLRSDIASDKHGVTDAG